VKAFLQIVFWFIVLLRVVTDVVRFVAHKVTLCPVCGRSRWVYINDSYSECGYCHGSYLDEDEYATIRRLQMPGDIGEGDPLCYRCSYREYSTYEGVVCSARKRRLLHRGPAFPPKFNSCTHFVPTEAGLMSSPDG
jgi:hypothetical protein